MRKQNILLVAMFTVFSSDYCFSSSERQSETIRPINNYISDYIVDTSSMANEFLNQLKSNLNDLTPDNLNKKLNNGEDLFGLDQPVSDVITRNDSINFAINDILETAQRIGKGVYDIVVHRTKNLLQRVKSNLFSKENNNRNYAELIKGLKEVLPHDDYLCEQEKGDDENSNISILDREPNDYNLNTYLLENEDFSKEEVNNLNRTTYFSFNETPEIFINNELINDVLTKRRHTI